MKPIWGKVGEEGAKVYLVSLGAESDNSQTGGFVYFVGTWGFDGECFYHYGSKTNSLIKL
jgi:hypothetical protein